MCVVRGGDIEAFVALRFVFVFDGLLAKLPDSRKKLYKGYLIAHQWKRAFCLWDINRMGLAHLRDVYWRHDFRIDVVTWQPPEIAELIGGFFDESNIPVTHTSAFEPEHFERELAYMPDVVKVFHGDQSMPFRFGGKGRLVSSLSTFQPLA
jgi:hypothetical protein